MIKIEAHPQGHGGKRRNLPQVENPHSTVLDATTRQLALCGAILQSLMPYVVPPTPEEISDPQNPEMDGGAKLATASACIATCNRIDTIMNDESRWGVDGFADYGKTVNAIAQAQLDNAKAHAEVLRFAGSAAANLNPQIFQHESGAWVAIRQGVPGTKPLVGTGVTAREAVDAFNRAYDALPDAPSPLPEATESVNQEQKDEPKCETKSGPKRKKRNS